MAHWMNLSALVVDTASTDDMRNALISLCTDDCDMNGENGDEYLWDTAKERGYESNAEFLADAAMNRNEDFKSMVDYFLRVWMDYDSWYYTDWGYRITDIPNSDNLVVLSVATREED